MRQVSAYITAMAIGISDDLKSYIAPNKLQFEVEKELEKQMLAQLVQAVGERDSSLRYGGDSVKQESSKKKVLRFMGYVSEMYTISREVKGVLMDGTQPLDTDFEVEEVYS